MSRGVQGHVREAYTVIAFVDDSGWWTVWHISVDGTALSP